MMNENRYRNGNVCSSCGASIPYGSFVCKNCNSPLRLEQVNANMNEKHYVTKRDKTNLLVPTLLIISVILIIMTIAVVVYIK